jgi:prophage regulatory protein
MKEATTQQIKADRFLRIKQICPDLLPISKASFWAGCKSGKYPAPTKLGPRTTVWRESEIQKIITDSKEQYQIER